MSESEKTKIQWHQGFYSGMEIELCEYRDSLTIETEHELSRSPLSFDMLVIRMDKDVEIKNPIAAFYRKHNIIEYKSPDDLLSIDVFYKVIAYTSLYKSFGKTVNEIPAEDITISIFRHRYPRKLFKELRLSGAKITKEADGIYLVEGLFYIPTWIIVTSQVGDEHIALKMLSRTVTIDELDSFLNSAEFYNESGDRELFQSVISVSSEANEDCFSTYEEEYDMARGMELLFKGERQQIEERAEEKGQDELVSAITELKSGKTKSELSSRFSKKTLERAMKCL